MMDPQNDIELRLTKLRELTDSIEPGPRFIGNVMLRLDAERGGWLRPIPSLWHHVLPVAVLLAMISAAWAYGNDRDADAQLAVAADVDDGTEIDWL